MDSINYKDTDTYEASPCPQRPRQHGSRTHGQRRADAVQSVKSGVLEARAGTEEEAGEETALSRNHERLPQDRHYRGGWRPDLHLGDAQIIGPDCPVTEEVPAGFEPATSGLQSDLPAHLLEGHVTPDCKTFFGALRRFLSYGTVRQAYSAGTILSSKLLP